MATVVELSKADLHASASDPVAASMNFLNEVANRYPEAISLAAGRPYEGFYTTKDIERYLEIYMSHLEGQGLDPAQVRRAMMQYGRTNGLIHELISTLLATDEQITVAPESVMVTVGGQEAMLIALRGLCASREDVLLAVSPCYVGITGAARILDIDVVPVPEHPDGADPAAIVATAAAVRASGRNPRALYLVPDFSNPSGLCLGLAARHGVLAAAAQADLLVIEDDPYGLFGLADTPRPRLKALDSESRVIYLGTFAKSCFPGARVGFLVADQSVVDPDGRRSLFAEELSNIKSMVTVNTSPITQAIIGGILIESGCSLRAANQAKIEFYRSSLRHLLAALERHFPPALRAELGVSWNTPAGGFFVVVSAPRGGPMVADEKLLEISAAEYGVLWTPMSFFYPDGGGSHAIRLSCSSLEHDEIDEGVARLAALVQAQLGGERSSSVVTNKITA